MKEQKISNRVNKQNKGFTLIELLVVISIVGLLSSIVLGSLNESRNKARIAKGKHFSSIIKHGIGDQLVGEWTFNNDNADDSSGYGNDGNDHGALYTDGVMGRAVVFDGSGDYIQLQSTINDSIITVAMWYYYEGVGGGGWNTLLCRNGGTYHHLLINDASREVGFYNSGWHSSGHALTLGKWHHLVLIKNGIDSKLYVDGDLKQDSNSSFNNSSYPLALIGNYGGHTQGAIGYIDEIMVFNKALTSAEIQQYYAEGLEEHQNLARK